MRVARNVRRAIFVRRQLIKDLSNCEYELCMAHKEVVMLLVLSTFLEWKLRAACLKLDARTDYVNSGGGNV